MQTCGLCLHEGWEGFSHAKGGAGAQRSPGQPDGDQREPACPQNLASTQASSSAFVESQWPFLIGTFAGIRTWQGGEKPLPCPQSNPQVDCFLVREPDPGALENGTKTLYSDKVDQGQSNFACPKRGKRKQGRGTRKTLPWPIGDTQPNKLVIRRFYPLSSIAASIAVAVCEHRIAAVLHAGLLF